MSKRSFKPYSKQQLPVEPEIVTGVKKEQELHCKLTITPALRETLLKPDFELVQSQCWRHIYKKWCPSRLSIRPFFYCPHRKITCACVLHQVTSFLCLHNIIRTNPCVLPTENKEADNSQQRPENEGETRRPQPLRCQRRQTQGWRENIHHLREGDAFLEVSPDPSRRAARCPISGGRPSLHGNTKWNKWLDGFCCFVKKKKMGKSSWWCSLFPFFAQPLITQCYFQLTMWLKQPFSSFLTIIIKDLLRGTALKPVLASRYRSGSSGPSAHRWGVEVKGFHCVAPRLVFPPPNLRCSSSGTILHGLHVEKGSDCMCFYWF